MKNLKIGLFGFGVVGEGIYQVLSSKQNLGLDIKKIVIKHPDKLRNAPSALFFTNRDAIIKDPEIDVVVELIDDSAAAFEIVKEALAAGKHVVSGNKKMIAENLPALLQLKESSGKSLLYEAAVGGSIPILRNLEEYFDNDLLHYVSGIVNGSTNYILTKMIEEAKGFDEALNLAKDNGFAESNPIMDVEGFDASFKLQIIALHAFGLIVPNDNILRKGIQSLLKGDIQFAFEKGCVMCVKIAG